MSTSPEPPAAASADRPVHGSPCPRCVSPLTDDPRFLLWCPACDWNLVPGGDAAPEPTRRERAAIARTDRLYEEQATGGDSPTARRDWLLASAAAGLIHLVTVGIFALALWLLIAGTVVQRCVGAVVLVIAVTLRPRLGRLPKDAGVLDRAGAPALYGLADRVAAEVGARPVDVIQVTDEFNASYGLVGVRRRSVLRLGLPLWEVLDDRERTALLGHEFGHRVNGDRRRSFWLYSAVSALRAWYGMARPGHDGLVVGRDEVSMLVRLGAAFGRLVLRGVAWVLYQGLVLFDRLTSRAGQQAEYHSDVLAARVAGGKAARGTLAALLLFNSVDTAIHQIRAEERGRPRIFRARSRRTEDAPAPPAPDLLWERVREHLASVPAIERERLLRLSARDRSAVDGSHPPTHLRIALAARGGDGDGAVTAAESASIATELAPHRARIAAGLLAG
ncbi:M48 family metallopeptidase [Streptomyces sp. 1331.2]|uniref:M48 family metallopeptidase n=1 Tax=Streptomyces sp. 1331.2 TaxID=1938835 RepID=UPI000BCD132D|nr:M48 family metallopeptidase [Streptomyces sp. 1331.2]SOB88811.1 Peptidase family M48 [Streptomyces sp. 1331.2]